MSHREIACAIALAVSLLPLALPCRAEQAAIRVDAAEALDPISPAMTGSCIEDVNHEIYGGLYDQKLFGESFEEPSAPAEIAGWTACGGAWRVDGAECLAAADPGGKLVRDAPDFADGEVEADIKVSKGGGNAGLLVRVRNAGVGADSFDGYEISVAADGSGVILGKHRHDWKPLKTAPAALAPNAWHHLRVVMNGPRLQIFVDRAASPIIDYTDTEAPLLAGKIALRTWNADAEFQNIRIQADAIVTVNQFHALPSYAVSGMWDAIKTGSAEARFQQGSSDPFNGTLCQMIQHGAGAGRVGVANRGLNRWGIAVRKGQVFAGRIALRGSDLHGPVTVALQSADGSVTYATQAISPIGAKWAMHRFTLKSRADDKNARFAIWLDQPGTLWADQATLMGTGAEQFHGLPIRGDIAKALVAEGITFLRYGGTMVNAPGYRWKKMIGDPDKRPPYTGHWYPYSTNGFGIFDFLNFCEAAHFEAAFAINIEETAQDAANLADYLTAPAASNPWGRKRAQDGHPAPYHAAYIEIGNEENFTGSPAGYAHYAERFKALAQAIHGRNPRIKLVCAAWWVPDSPAMKTVFDAVNGQAAAWDLHVNADSPHSGEQVDRQIAQMQRLFTQWDPHTTLKAVIFEENGGLHDMQRALGHATVLNAARRHGNFVLADCPANCLQPWKQNDNGWDQGQLFFTPTHAWAMPPYYAQQIAAENYEPLRVQSEVGDGNDLDVLATRSKDSQTLVLSVVNIGASPARAAIALSGFGHGEAALRETVLSGALDAVNPPDGPEQIAPRRSQRRVQRTLFEQEFPAHSVTVLRLDR